MSRPLSDVLEATANALDATEDLTTLSGIVEVSEFVDLLEHAAAIAAEVEYLSAAAGQVAQTNVPPAYPPLVALLARALVVDAPAQVTR